MSRPLGTLLRELLMLWSFDVGVAKDIEKLVDERAVTLLCSVDGKLRQIVAENVVRVDGVHLGATSFIAW